MFPDIPEEQIRATVEHVATQSLAEACIDQPPVDAALLAKRLGITVARDSAGAGTRARFVRLGGESPTILLADEPRPERRQWAVAHEIGESCAVEVFAALGVNPLDGPPAAREAIANRLAGCLLLPREWFAADGPAVTWDLLELKARYATASHELIARRMLDMSPPVIITVADHGRIAWRRGNRHNRTPPMTPPEKDAWRGAHAINKPVQCEPRELPAGIEDVRVWPVHEPDWKREIVRSALADEW
jgi:Zn-dependent peptidase ImmA (M78 family)